MYQNRSNMEIKWEAQDGAGWRVGTS